MFSTFSFSRLGKLITKQLFENSRLYLFSILALFGLISLVLAFWLAFSGPRYNEESLVVIFLFGLFIAGTVFASLSFNMLGNKDKGIYWMSIPATHLEKLITTILFSTVAFTLIYFLCFFLVKTIFVSILTGMMAKDSSLSYNPITKENEMSRIFSYMMYAFVAVQSLYLLGSIYFSRYSFIITTVIGSALLFAFVYYMSKIDDSIPGSWNILSIRDYGSGSEDTYKEYAVSPTIKSILEYTMKFAWAPLFWVVTWFRLKEKQI